MSFKAHEKMKDDTRVLSLKYVISLISNPLNQNESANCQQTRGKKNFHTDTSKFILFMSVMALRKLKKHLKETRNIHAAMFQMELSAESSTS